MKYPGNRKKKYSLRAGIILLFGSTVVWISHIIAMANNLNAWTDAIMAAIIVTAIPAGLGILGIWYASRSPEK